MDDRVRLDVEGAIATITNDHPGKHNAFDDAMDEALFEILDELKARRDVRAVIWRGEGKELVSAGVNLVAVDTRGYIPGSAIPNEGGDPRELTQLVNAINAAGDAAKLKIAAFDTPASMTDKMNQIVHGTGGYSPPFDFSVTTGSGNGGYQYLWNNDLEAFFQAVPSSMLHPRRARRGRLVRRAHPDLHQPGLQRADLRRDRAQIRGGRFHREPAHRPEPRHDPRQ